VVWAKYVWNEGIAIADRIPMIGTTIISSIRVKPESCLFGIGRGVTDPTPAEV
jgi:hypothetical protein